MTHLFLIIPATSLENIESISGAWGAWLYPDKRGRGWHHADICHVVTNVVTMTIGPAVTPDTPLLSAVRQLHKLLSIEYHYNLQHQDGKIIYICYKYITRILAWMEPNQESFIMLWLTKLSCIIVNFLVLYWQCWFNCCVKIIRLFV